MEFYVFIIAGVLMMLLFTFGLKIPNFKEK